MTRLRATRAIGLGFCGALLVARSAGAQMPLPAVKPPDGATRKKIDEKMAKLADKLNAMRQKSAEDIKDDAAAGILLDEASQIAADLAVATTHRTAPTQARRSDAH